MLLSLAASLPTMAFLSVKNRLTASEPPAESDPPEPATASAKFLISVSLFALIPTAPADAEITASSVIVASTSVSITLKPKAPANASSFVDTPPAAIKVSASCSASASMATSPVVAVIVVVSPSSVVPSSPIMTATSSLRYTPLIEAPMAFLSAMAKAPTRCRVSDSLNAVKLDAAEFSVAPSPMIVFVLPLETVTASEPDPALPPCAAPPAMASA